MYCFFNVNISSGFYVLLVGQGVTYYLFEITPIESVPPFGLPRHRQTLNNNPDHLLSSMFTKMYVDIIHLNYNCPLITPLPIVVKSCEKQE